MRHPAQWHDTQVESYDTGREYGYVSVLCNRRGFGLGLAASFFCGQQLVPMGF